MILQPGMSYDRLKMFLGTEWIALVEAETLLSMIFLDFWGKCDESIIFINFEGV